MYIVGLPPGMIITSSGDTVTLKRLCRSAATSTHYGVRTYGRNTVTFSTYVLGTDPDPRIRHGLMQDIGSKFGGGPD